MSNETNKPIYVSQEEAIAIFCDPKQVNGSTFIRIDTVTIPKLSGGKKNPMQGNVRKFNIGSNVQVFQNKNGSSYANAVEKRMAKEGIDPDTWTVQPHVWGERIPNTPILVKRSDTSCKYLECIFIKSGEVSYKLNGQPIAKGDIEGLQEKQESNQGGQEEKVIIRAYAWDSIVSFRLNKQDYIVTN